MGSRISVSSSLLLSFFFFFFLIDHRSQRSSSDVEETMPIQWRTLRIERGGCTGRYQNRSLHSIAPSSGRKSIGLHVYGCIPRCWGTKSRLRRPPRSHSRSDPTSSQPQPSLPARDFHRTFSIFYLTSPWCKYIRRISASIRNNNICISNWSSMIAKKRMSSSDDDKHLNQHRSYRFCKEKFITNKTKKNHGQPVDIFLFRVGFLRLSEIRFRKKFLVISTA